MSMFTALPPGWYHVFQSGEHHYYTRVCPGVIELDEDAFYLADVQRGTSQVVPLREDSTYLGTAVRNSDEFNSMIEDLEPLYGARA